MALKPNKREPVMLSQMRPFTLFLVLCGCILFTYGLINISDVLARFVTLLTPKLNLSEHTDEYNLIGDTNLFAKRRRYQCSPLLIAAV